MVEIEKITVRLGEKDFEIQQAGFLRAKPWKKRLLEEIKPLFELLNDAPNLEFNSPSDLLKLMPMAESLLIDGVDTVFEMLIAYSAELESERAYIEAHATDKQIVSAFQGVVLLADPFGLIAQANRRIGRTAIGTL